MFTPLAAFSLAVGMGFTPAPAARQVVVEARILTLTPESAQKFRALMGLGDAQTSSAMTEARTRELVEAMNSDRSVNIMAAPRLTTLENQQAVIQVGEEETVITGFDVKPKNGQVVYIPKPERLFVGYKLAYTPSLNETGDVVRLALDSALSSKAVGSNRAPFTYEVTPILSGGAKGPSVPVTQWIEDAKLEIQQVKTTLEIPNNRTVVLAAGLQMVESRSEEPIPVLSNLPRIGKLFTNPVLTRERREVYLMVTTRIPPE